MTANQERAFWVGVRKAMIELIRVIEIRYELESAIVTNAQRKQLRRTLIETQQETAEESR